MKLSVISRQIQAHPADALIVPVFSGEPVPSGATGGVDTALGSPDGVPGNGAIARLISLGDYSGKLSEVAVLYSFGLIPAARVLLVGLGNPEALTTELIRQAMGAAARKSQELGCKRIATLALGAGRAGISLRDAAQATVEGALLGAYQFEEHRTGKPKSALEELVLLEANPALLDEAATGARSGEVIANAQNNARTLMNRPPNVLNPASFAAWCADMASETGLACTIMEQPQIEALRMGGVLGVARGSANRPRFIVLEHGLQTVGAGAPLVLIGKGVTFDTGGYSIKTTDGMVGMKGDMGGAAAVAGAMQAIATLNPTRAVVGLMPLVENMISQDSFRPNDVLAMMNGMTVEITSTDAEGRLILADALHFAKRYNPAGVVDIATLTGTANVAMGRNMAATLHAPDDAWAAALLAASARAGERLWRMPLWADYGERMKSDTADMKNGAGDAGAGLGVSAWFLQQFTLAENRSDPAYRWAHLDIAPMMAAKSTSGYQPAGSMGFGVRTMVALALEPALTPALSQGRGLG